MELRIVKAGKHYHIKKVDGVTDSGRPRMLNAVINGKNLSQAKYDFKIDAMKVIRKIRKEIK